MTAHILDIYEINNIESAMLDYVLQRDIVSPTDDGKFVVTTKIEECFFDNEKIALPDFVKKIASEIPDITVTQYDEDYKISKIVDTRKEAIDFALSLDDITFYTYEPLRLAYDIEGITPWVFGAIEDEIGIISDEIFDTIYENRDDFEDEIYDAEEEIYRRIPASAG